MMTLQTPPAARAEPTEPRIPLNLFVAYDDFESGRRAMELVLRLGGATSDGIDLMPVLWRVDILYHDQSRPGAIDDARRADIFVLGLSHGNSFRRLAPWLNQALTAHHSGPTAIVAAIPDSFAREPEGKVCLSELAGIACRFGATLLPTGPRQSHSGEPDTPACPLLSA